MDEQRDIYYGLWSNRRWRILAGVFFSRFVMGRLGRDPAFFRYADARSVSEVILKRVEHGLAEMSVCDNYYVHYILTGNYTSKTCMPPYLLEQNYSKLKDNLARATFVVDSVEGYIRERPRGMVTKMNLSNIFEYMSDGAMSDMFDVLIDYCADNLVLEYRTLLVPRDCPESHKASFLIDDSLGERLSSIDRSFFYGSYVVLRRKQP